MGRQAVCLFPLASSVLFLATAVAQSIPFFGRPSLVAPAVSRDGRIAVFGSAVTPAGAVTDTADLYVSESIPTGDVLRQLTHYSGNGTGLGVTAVSLSSDGTTAAFTVVGGGPGGGEEVHLIDTPTGRDRTLVIDTEGCVLPLATCPFCFFTCLRAPHLSPDGGQVLYWVARERPFYVVSVDGSGPRQLPAYSGLLAPAPQRVIGGNGLAVFTSSAPFGPTFAASATDVYVMNLDGTGIRNLTKFGNDPSIYAQNAVISADGATVVFESNLDPNSRGPGKVTQVFAVNTDGTRLRPLTSDAEASSSPSLSADGSRVVFVHRGQVYKASTSEESAPTPLTNFRRSVASEPVISDDGSLVAFIIGPASGGGGAIYVVKTGGGDPRPLYAPPALNLGGVIGIAAYEEPSAGSFVSVYGRNFGADSMVVADGLPLPTTLGGVSLLVNGEPVPLWAVTPWQLIAQLPQTVPEGPTSFQIRGADGATTPGVTAEVKSVAPAVFIYEAPAPDPGFVYWQAAAFHAGTAEAADPAHPARTGETLEIYGSGLGRTDPAVAAGAPAPASPPARALVTPQVLIGDRPAIVTFAGLAAGMAGVYQVNAIVPDGLAPGLHGLTWLAGKGSFYVGSIAVQ